MGLDSRAIERLSLFRKQKCGGKGCLATVLYVTRHARGVGLPLDVTSLRTQSKGQVSGLSKSAIQRILKDYGITRTLAQEGGRTSRGSLGNMEAYVDLLNSLHRGGLADLEKIERWWIDAIREYFAAQPFVLKSDPAISLSSAISDLLAQAEQRQAEDEGATYVGTVLQHLVGAKIELAFDRLVEHHGASVADAVSGRPGDFVIDNVAVHVTTAPSEALLDKCLSNLESSFSPLIVTLGSRVAAARQMAEIKRIADRVDVFAAEQFIAANLLELGASRRPTRKATLEQLVDRYNTIVEKCETDPSLRIKVS